MSERIYYSQEIEEMMKRHRVITALAFMAMGMGIGAMMAILFARDDGEKIRRMIAEALEDSYQRGREFTDDAIDTIRK
jgi:gas vesicle protein